MTKRRRHSEPRSMTPPYEVDATVLSVSSRNQQTIVSATLRFTRRPRLKPRFYDEASDSVGGYALSVNGRQLHSLVSRTSFDPVISLGHLPMRPGGIYGLAISPLSRGFSWANLVEIFGTEGNICADIPAVPQLHLIRSRPRQAAPRQATSRDSPDHEGARHGCGMDSSPGHKDVARS